MPVSRPTNSFHHAKFVSGVMPLIAMYCIVLNYRILACTALSCLVLSCLVLSCFVFYCLEGCTGQHTYGTKRSELWVFEMFSRAMLKLV